MRDFHKLAPHPSHAITRLCTIPRMKTFATISRSLVLLAAAGVFSLGTGCTTSTITPMRAMQRVEYVVDVPASQPATSTARATTASAPATEPAPLAATTPATEPSTQIATTSTAPATQPTVRVTKVKIVDPNQTARYVYAATYDHIWEESMALLVREGYRIDRQDYREGVLTTIARPAAHILEAWRDDWVGGKHAAENTVNTQRRTVRITIAPVEGKPDFYEVAAQVLVERQDNPSETINAPIFVEGSAFGRNAVTVQSDFLDSTFLPPGNWRIEGHDLSAEKQVLDRLFKKI